MRRRDLVILLVTAVSLSTLATWVGAAQIRSPAEEAARTAPPTPSPILVPVQRRELATKVVTRGTAEYGSVRQVVLADSALKSGTRIVTSVQRIDAEVSPGEVLLTVSGRPVFLFEGARPSYRDLGPGLSGPDVRQLERGLVDAGLDPGSVDGRYDAATGTAVAALYESHRAAPLMANAAQLASVRPLEAAMLRGSSAAPGVQLPADEVVFVPATPVRVARRMTEPGSSPDGAVLSVTGSRVVIEGALPVEQAGLVEVGARVDIDEPALGIAARGLVARKAPHAGTGGADGFHVAFDVAVRKPPPGLVGASVRLTVPIESTGSAVLAVPVSAVSLGADGRPRVRKAVAGTPGDYVPVRTGLSVDGYVAVTPLTDGLDEGDRVVIGFRGTRNGGG